MWRQQCFQPPRFAMKGGTALNLFVQGMPRLSVDIDVVFTDHTLDREAALKAIATDLNAVKSAISALVNRGVARSPLERTEEEHNGDEEETGQRLQRRVPRITDFPVDVIRTVLRRTQRVSPKTYRDTTPEQAELGRADPVFPLTPAVLRAPSQRLRITQSELRLTQTVFPFTQGLGKKPNPRSASIGC